jgi:hypothetical protein
MSIYIYENGKMGEMKKEKPFLAKRAQGVDPAGRAGEPA